MASARKKTEPSPTDLLSSVMSAFDDEKRKTVFAIGGCIDMTPNEAIQGPLVIRWDSGEEDQCHKIALPIKDDAASQDAFSRLMEDCDPATFGQGNKTVFDETYRKAKKIDAAKFSTSFSPYEPGIMDTISQALVDATYRGIRAELYSLNIYSAPSGKFKPHVDTPRSKDQMGSLVVCLPNAHQGGGLAVRHGNREILFDWGNDKPLNIRWAAFFSDCEHEVFEVTSGHRLTLTYNLYWTSYGPASMADNLSLVEPKSQHFFTSLEKLLASPKFLPEGGTIGFHCNHAYPHTSASRSLTLHTSLKGVDMVVYQALKSIEDSTRVVSFLQQEEYKSYRDWQDDEDEISEDEISEDERSKKAKDEGVATSESCLGELLQVNSICRSYENDEDQDPATCGFALRNVAWLNERPVSAAKELASAFPTYGNEPGIGTFYTSAVIIAELPAYKKRRASEQ